MKPTYTLVTIRHGSHLYGTNTPESDLDLKSVHIPSGETIVLGCPENHINRNIESKVNGKNTKNAIDDVSFSLAKWINMLAEGDTVGTEILFAPESAIVYQHENWTIVRAMAMKLVNRQITGYVAYCQRQAAKYGIKGSRMASCEAIITLLFDLETKAGGLTKLNAFRAELEAFCATDDFSDIVNLPSPHGTAVWYLDVLSRKSPLSSSIKNALDLYRKVYDQYGQRAIAAKSNAGVDWKAMSHAIRVSGQALELLRTGKIAFPRPEHDLLLEIKQGNIDFEQTARLLELMVASLEGASEASKLPEITDQRDVANIIKLFYTQQVIGE